MLLCRKSSENLRAGLGFKKKEMRGLFTIMIYDF